MNFAQFALFVFYVLSVFFAGVGVYRILDKNDSFGMAKALYLGETLLLGSILVIGEFLALSLFGLYKHTYLLAVTSANYLFILNKDNRLKALSLIKQSFSLNLANFIFVALLGILMFRNLYFMVDVDSISTYLFTQRLWLSVGTSIVGNMTNDMRIFVPQFDCVPYALGLSIFGQETLFPQLINLFWRLIVMLLVYGYAAYRINKWCALAAVMLIAFDGHFFYSGANQWVLINGALIALLFSSAYNFWEARIGKRSHHFLLGVIFLSQLPANKYQMAYVIIFMSAVALLCQSNLLNNVKNVFIKKKRFIMAAIIIVSLWYVKNAIVAADPVFPIFADRFNVFGWTSEKVNIFVKIFGGVSPGIFVKYMNYLFVWPGITSAKYVVLIISFLPLIFLTPRSKAARDNSSDNIVELCYWLGLSILILMGICLFCHQDPRYYRYPIAIFSFSVVLSIVYICENNFSIRKTVLVNAIILFSALPGYKIVYDQGGSFKRPALKENIGVLTNRIHMDYMIEKYYPNVLIVAEAFRKNPEKIGVSAWDAIQTGMNFPAFLLPIRPVISPWLSSTIRWDSYVSEEAVIGDLRYHDINWVMSFRDRELVFVSAKDYAAEAVKFERYPKRIYFDYGFPRELSSINY